MQWQLHFSKGWGCLPVFHSWMPLLLSPPNRKFQINAQPHLSTFSAIPGSGVPEITWGREFKGTWMPVIAVLPTFGMFLQAQTPNLMHFYENMHFYEKYLYTIKLQK